MNELAIKLEEQIISLFQDKETQICQGWIVKKMGEYLFVYPLYYKFSQESIPENIRKCEEIGRQSGMDCMFRIVEHTNYRLISMLTDNGYELKKYGVVGEWIFPEGAGNLCVGRKQPDSLFLKNGTGRKGAEYVMANADKVIGIKRQGLLFLPDGNLPCVEIEDILRFAMENGITRVLADISEKEELPEQYRRTGFCRAYLYRCYQKEEKENMENGSTE